MSLDVADPDQGAGLPAIAVETCECPWGYSGTSCEVGGLPSVFLFTSCLRGGAFVHFLDGTGLPSAAVRAVEPMLTLCLPRQVCLPGFFRVGGVLFGGNCLQCECNDHGSRCDSDGVCQVSCGCGC